MSIMTKANLKSLFCENNHDHKLPMTPKQRDSRICSENFVTMNYSQRFDLGY